jgi:hypothetical protein
LTVSNFTPALPATYTATGLPVVVLPNAAVPGNISIAYNAPAAPALVAATVFTLDGDAGPIFGAGHNRDVTLSAQAQALDIYRMMAHELGTDGDDLPAAGPAMGLPLAANFLDLLAVFGETTH